MGRNRSIGDLHRIHDCRLPGPRKNPKPAAYAAGIATITNYDGAPPAAELDSSTTDNMMAILVCYFRSLPGNHTRDKAIYLDQRFYESIFRHCRSDGGPYTVLREIAMLRYKSPTLVVTAGRVETLDQELAALRGVGAVAPADCGIPAGVRPSDGGRLCPGNQRRLVS